MKLGLAHFLVAAVGAALLAPPAATAATLSLENGVLRLVDDPGKSSSLALDRRLVDGSVRFVGRSMHIDAMRPGPGCAVVPGTEGGGGVALVTMCPAEGVVSVDVAAGDGDDELFIGTLNSDLGAITVPVAVDLGPGADYLSAVMNRQPVRVAGGDGPDAVVRAAGASVLTFDGGPGNDALQLSPGDPDEPGVVLARPPDETRFDGGAGDDRATLSDVPGTATLDGGDGADSLQVFKTRGRVALSGGAGNDVLQGLALGGPALLDGGTGNDRLRLNRADVEAPSVRGGHAVARGGPGDDEFTVARDGDSDEIDCGPGADRFTFLREGEREPPKEDSYTRNCPPFGTRIAKTGTVAGGTLVVTVTARESLRVAVVAGDRRRQLAEGRGRLRRGTTYVTLRLTARGRAQLRGKRVVELIVIAAATRDGSDVDAPSQIVRFSAR